jgi:hypothetical protein
LIESGKPKPLAISGTTSSSHNFCGLLGFGESHKW